MLCDTTTLNVSAKVQKIDILLIIFNTHLNTFSISQYNTQIFAEYHHETWKRFLDLKRYHSVLKCVHNLKL